MFNPFPTNGYYGKKYFCGRDEELKRLISALHNQRNITLISLRRMGKTSLIKHFFENAGKEYVSIYIDLYPTQNLADFLNVVAAAVVSKLESGFEKIARKIGDIFSGISAGISFDTLTGEPKLEISKGDPVSQNLGIDNIFRYLSEYKGRIILAFDEFQQINNYPDKNVEAILRSQIQNTGNVNFIFSGSNKEMMSLIFSDYKRPFYHSSEIFWLSKIAHDEYAKFIERKFHESGKKISGEAVEFILSVTQCYTYYVQYLCNRGFSGTENEVTKKDAEMIFHQVLKENEIVFQKYERMLTSNQWKILNALAMENGTSEPSSKYFIRKYNLGATSSVMQSIHSLVKKEMIYEEDEKYIVYDVFLAAWMKYIYNQKSIPIDLN